MLDPASQRELRDAIAECISADNSILSSLREEIRPLKSSVKRIQPRSTTSISLVATDGGNNQLQFDPFLVQLIRVVDSSNNEYCLEAVSPTTPISSLSWRHLDNTGEPRTALGEMMSALGVTTLPQLSHMIRPNDDGRPVSPSWVQVYRELVEWATLFALLKKDFGTDTLIVCDGLLRSKVFAGDLFARLRQQIEDRIRSQWDRSKRRIYLAGVAKHSKVLTRYRLAMALEEVMQVSYPAYVEVPRDIEERAYIWSEFARGDDEANQGGEANKYVGGKMFLVKFGAQSRDPIWPVDIFQPQVPDAQIIVGSMLADAINGFPVPHYPRCLQKAHENAALVDFDFDILQDVIYEGVRKSLGSQAEKLDIFQLQDADPAQKRYS
ncbi:MAG: DNA double-strand break repair nuclease NurA [Mesorhizobium sp.]|nr:MAG: DNA double-strand break repair nuclease NurA [Mesorhizobium sp.]